MALRRKDRPDIRPLIEHLETTDASAENYADLCGNRITTLQPVG